MNKAYYLKKLADYERMYIYDFTVIAFVKVKDNGKDRRLTFEVNKHRDLRHFIYQVLLIGFTNKKGFVEPENYKSTEFRVKHNCDATLSMKANPEHLISHSLSNGWFYKIRPVS